MFYLQKWRLLYTKKKKKKQFLKLIKIFIYFNITYYSINKDKTTINFWTLQYSNKIKITTINIR